MKKTFRSVIASGLGLTLALTASYAVAQTWTSAPGTPPNSNAPAPLNVSASHQSKLAGLDLNTSTTNPDTYGLNVWGLARFYNSIQIPTGAGAGKVLTSDASGIGSWQPAPVGNTGGTGNPPPASGGSVTMLSTPIKVLHYEASASRGATSAFGSVVYPCTDFACSSEATEKAGSRSHTTQDSPDGNQAYQFLIDVSPIVPTGTKTVILKIAYDSGSSFVSFLLDQNKKRYFLGGSWNVGGQYSWTGTFPMVIGSSGQRQVDIFVHSNSQTEIDVTVMGYVTN